MTFNLGRKIYCMQGLHKSVSCDVTKFYFFKSFHVNVPSWSFLQLPFPARHLCLPGWTRFFFWILRRSTPENNETSASAAQKRNNSVYLWHLSLTSMLSTKCFLFSPTSLAIFASFSSLLMSSQPAVFSWAVRTKVPLCNISCVIFENDSYPGSRRKSLKKLAAPILDFSYSGSSMKVWITNLETLNFFRCPFYLPLAFLKGSSSGSLTNAYLYLSVWGSFSSLLFKYPCP